MGCGTLSTVAVHSWSDTELQRAHKSSSGHSGEGSTGLRGEKLRTERTALPGSARDNGVPAERPNGQAGEARGEPQDRDDALHSKEDWRFALHNVSMSGVTSVGKPSGKSGAAVSASGASRRQDVSETELEHYVNGLIAAATLQVMADSKLITGHSAAGDRSTCSNGQHSMVAGSAGHSGLNNPSSAPGQDLCETDGAQTGANDHKVMNATHTRTRNTHTLAHTHTHSRTRNTHTLAHSHAEHTHPHIGASFMHRP